MVNQRADRLATSGITVVEEGTTFKGALISTCAVVVRGTIEGEITAPSLTVSTTGAVRGMGKVREIDSQGEVSGQFDADSARLSGVIKNRTVVRARSLDIKLSLTSGRVEIVFGEHLSE